MSAPPSFETARLLLTPVDTADVPTYQKNFADYEVIRHLTSRVPWPYPENGVQEFFETVLLPEQGRTWWSWSLRLKNETAEVIGCVTLRRPGTPENRGFWLARRLWGQGLMTEAVVPVTDYAFAQLGFEKLTFANAVGNLRSRRIKEKTGARFLEVKPARFVDPRYTEHELWELRKEDWLKFRRRDSEK